MKGLTMTSELEIEDVRDLYVDDAEEALILSLKLLLVEDLDSNHARVLHSTAHIRSHHQAENSSSRKRNEIHERRAGRQVKARQHAGRRPQTTRLEGRGQGARTRTYMSKFSFQYGFSVFLMTEVV
jgi:hypothetical protein